MAQIDIDFDTSGGGTVYLLHALTHEPRAGLLRTLSQLPHTSVMAWRSSGATSRSSPAGRRGRPAVR
jgi:hypothetical protein